MIMPDPRSIEPTREDNNFDILRLVAAGMVLYWHSFVLTGHMALEPLYRMSGETTNPGSIGVKVFFLISGFLVTGSLLRSRSIGEFAFRRCLRILPALATVLLVSVLVIGSLMTSLSPGEYLGNGGTWSYLANIFCTKIQWGLPGCFTGNPFTPTVNGALWTLPHEMACYALLAFLGVGTLLRRGIAPWVALVVTFALDQAARAPVGQLFPPALLWLKTSDFLHLSSLFAAGMCLHQLRDRLPVSATAAMVCLVVMIAAIPAGQLDAIFILCGSYFVFWLAHANLGWIAGLCRKADLSYGVFLWGAPLQQCLAAVNPIHANQHPKLFLILSICAVVPIAMLSWRLVEKPALGLRRLWPASWCGKTRIDARDTTLSALLGDGVLFAGLIATAVLVSKPFHEAEPPSIVEFGPRSMAPLAVGAPENARYMWLKTTGTISPATRLRFGGDLLPLVQGQDGVATCLLPADPLQIPGAIDFRLEDTFFAKPSGWGLLHIQRLETGERPAIVDHGPNSITLGAPFNVQASGRSAFWLKVARLKRGRTEVMVGRTILPANVGDDGILVSLELDHHVITRPGITTLIVRDEDGRCSEPCLVAVQ